MSFNFLGDLKKMSENYSRKVSIILTAAIVNRFRDQKTPLTRTQLGYYYDIPTRVVTNICDRLHKAKLINYVVLAEDKVGVAPASETDTLTVGELLRKLDSVGDHNFIPRFSIIYRQVLDKIDSWLKECYDCLEKQLIRDIELPVDADKEAVVNAVDTPFLKTEDSDDSPVSTYE